jgi:dihydrofolate synthase/folylpolyglutamate synthase
MGLHRVEQVRARLDLNFDVPVIAVAGTNGKGSTCAMLESIALRAGYRVGLYSKPHLVHFEERCRVNGGDGRRVGFARRISRRSNSPAVTSD